MKSASILIVDDEEKTRRILQINLQNSYNLHLAGNGRDALKILQSNTIDIVLTDLKMPEIDGTEVLKEVQKSVHPIPVIIMTAYGTIENAVAMMKHGAFDYIVKPVNLDQIDVALNRALQHVKLIQENAQLRSQLRSIEALSNILTANEKMQEVLKSVEQVASTNYTVLIEGETGTGKELIARAVHNSSPRATQAFIAVNCGAIPHELLESEFFGSERGAFTGANARRIGKFEQANHGTIFLDEIGELPLDLQVKLLRAIEEQVIVRVGGSEKVSLDFRIVAATNRKLKFEVEANRFRSDLYYRLNVVNIQLPPLRERSEDIPLLAQHFLLKHRQSVGKNQKGFETNTLTYLKAHQWPGNVRELENIVVRSMVSAQSEYIGIDELPSDFHLQSAGESDMIPSSYQDFLAMKKQLKEEYIKKIEKDFILEGLRNNHWNVSQTSRALSMDRRLLQNMMKDLGLKTPENDSLEE
jgi:DNA-binding NtrC family response regulator